MTQELQKPARSRRILVIDEDVDSLDVLLEPLKWEGYDSFGVTSIDEALKKILDWQPLIVLLDVKDFLTGLSYIEKIRSVLPHGSCLMLSDDSSTEALIRALDAGADDYLVKPFVPLELLARVRTHLRIRDLQEELLFANEKLKEMVDTDDLTGLFNMRSLYQKLDFEMQRARRFNRPLCVIMLDMDDFKNVNDGHDHLFGSFVISEVGKMIKANTRNIDIPARYGGDEFLIVLTEVNFEGSVFFCERLRQSIEQKKFQHGNDSIDLTVSVGFAMLGNGENISARELVRRADQALYEAKRRGRNRVICYNEEMAKEKAVVERTQARHEARNQARLEANQEAAQNSRLAKKKSVG